MHVHRIHREVATCSIFFTRRKNNSLRKTAIRFFIIFAKCGDFKEIFLHWYTYASQCLWCCCRFRKYVHDVFWLRCGCNVDVLRNLSLQHVSDTASYPPCVVAGIGNLLDKQICILAIRLLQRLVEDVLRE